MRLTRVGRLLYAVLALANLWLLLRLMPRAEWFGIVLYTLLTSLFAWPAISGRDPFAHSRHGARWIAVPDAPRDQDTPPGGV
jgi:hypothetical protein